MNKLIQRPLLLFCAAFVLLCALFFTLPFAVSAGLFAVLLVCLSLLLVVYRQKINTAAIVLALVSVIYIFFSSLSVQLPKSFSQDSEGHIYSGTVLRADNYGSTQRYTLKLQRQNADSVNLPIKVYYEASNGTFSVKENIEILARLKKAPENDFSPLADGVCLYAYDVKILKADPPKDTPLIERFRQYAKRAIYSVLPNSQRHISFPLAKAIILGEKQALSQNTYESFSKSGIAHIFCVSGLHLTLIVSFLFLLLQTFFVPVRIRSALCIAVTFFYMATVGFTPSIIRSGIMMIIYLFGFFLRRQTDSLTSLSFAALVISIFSPGTVFDIGAQLSFLATLGLICSGYFLDTFLNFRTNFIVRFILEALFSTVFATAFCLPCTIFVFERISLSAYISNLLVIYPATFALLFLLLIVLLFPFGFLSPLFSLLGRLSSYLLVMTKELSDTFCALPFSSFPAKETLFLQAVFFIVLFVLLVLFSINNKKICAIFMCAVFVLNFVAISCFALAYFHDLKSFDTGIYTDKNSKFICAKDGGTYFICDISDGKTYKSTTCFFYGENALEFSDTVFDACYGRNVYFIPLSKDTNINSVISNIKAVCRYSEIALCIISAKDASESIPQEIKKTLSELNIPYTVQNEYEFANTKVSSEGAGLLHIENKNRDFVFLFRTEYDKRIFESYDLPGAAVYLPNGNKTEYILFPQEWRFFSYDNVKSYSSAQETEIIKKGSYFSVCN